MRRKTVPAGAILGSALVAALAVLWAIARHRQLEALLAAARVARQTAVAQALEEARAERQARARLLDRLENDPDTERSILKGLRLSFEAQPPGPRADELNLMVSIEKPLGRRYVVDDPAQSCVLYVGGRPGQVLRQDGGGDDPRTVLEAETGSIHRLFRVPGELPRGALLAVEWVNYNPRTGESEKLRSAP